MIEPKLEAEIITRFVKRERRARLLEFASKPDRRDQLLQEINSPGIFDQRFISGVSGSQRSADNLPSVFKKNGMGGRVYVMSEHHEWDAQKFQMSYIIGECLSMCFDTLGYCWKSKTAFFEWHHSGETYFLSKS